MDKIFLFSPCIIFAVCVCAQNVTRVNLREGKGSHEFLGKETYANPAFVSGTVEYRNGAEDSGLLNYNRMLGTIQYIDKKGDTLALQNEAAISRVSIGHSVFYYAPLCLQIIAGTDSIKLARNERIRIDGRSRQFVTKTVNYYIGNADNHFENAERKNFIMLFPKLQKSIKEYLQDNPTNFSSQEDLIKFTVYLARL